MRSRLTLPALLFIIFIYQQIAGAEMTWQPANAGLGNIDIRSIAVFAQEGRFVCAASPKSVYFSDNKGNFWQEIFFLEGEGSAINFVTFDNLNSKVLYSATTQGLFVTRNQGQDWQRIFRKVSEKAKNVSWIVFDPLDCQKIFIGTEEDLYLSQDLGANWTKANGGLPRSQIRSIAVHPFNPQVVYLANNYGLFKSLDSAVTWRRIYVTSHKVGAQEETEEEGGQISEEENLINCIAVDKRDPKKIFIATGRGVFVSHNAGKVWNKLPTRGLTCDYVNFIVISNEKDILYAATKNGVFEFLPYSNCWQRLYQGMPAGDVNSLSLNMQEGQLFAATERGIFRLVELEGLQQQANLSISEIDDGLEQDRDSKIDFEQALKELSLDEPSILELQEAALRYAEVIHPDNIKTLRRNARLKALLPDVTVDYDKTIQSGGTSTNFGDFAVGPRDWGLSFSWDIGDLVFSEQVRLIDSNARLLVQLRDDILNEITRLYYERRKLQIELDLTASKAPEEDLAKKLRLEELTANIDALTGGYLSRHIK